MNKEVLYLHTEIGLLELTAESGALSSVYPVSRRGEDLFESRFIRDCADQLRAYLSGTRQNFDIPLKLRGTDFQKSVWAELMKVPYGETRSYKEICARIGRPKAARAVGNAVGKNPVLIVVPCHRIISADGSLGGFTAGLPMKKKLLALEAGCK